MGGNRILYSVGGKKSGQREGISIYKVRLTGHESSNRTQIDKLKEM